MCAHCTPYYTIAIKVLSSDISSGWLNIFHPEINYNFNIVTSLFLALRRFRYRLIIMRGFRSLESYTLVKLNLINRRRWHVWYKCQSLVARAAHLRPAPAPPFRAFAHYTQFTWLRKCSYSCSLNTTHIERLLFKRCC